MPLSGRFFEALQEKYTANRLVRGTATLDSQSESVLRYLREKGLKGIPSAFKEAQKIYRTDYWGDTAKMLLFDATGFFLITFFGKKLPRFKQII